MAIEERIVKRLLAGTEVTADVEQQLVALVQNAKDGHLCDVVEELSLPEHVCSCTDDPFPQTPLVKHGNRLYLQKNWALETLLLQRVHTLLKSVPAPDVVLPNNLLPAQAAAVQKALGQQLSIFTGGPGTGKTFTATCFIRLLAVGQYRVKIAAPTGKAAAHLESALRVQGQLPEGLDCESMTLHRLLKLSPSMQRFGNPEFVRADLVVVDEASMLDASLMLHLLEAIGPETRLLLLGDPDQLPPVDGGSVFADMAEMFGSRLERSMRTDNNQLLDIAQNIQAGQRPEIPLLSCTDFLSSLHTHVSLPTSTDPLVCLQQQSRSRILTALRQGPFGADALNQHILSQLQKPTALPILITQNDPKRQLYNGTTGVLMNSKAYFLLSNELKSFPEATLPRYELAFCLSVHKSQGSEFDEVFALFPPGSEQFGREALYTAVTRAKKRVTVVSDEATVGALLRTSSRTRSGFRERFLALQQGK